MTSPTWKTLCMKLLNNKYARHTCENSAVQCTCGLTELKREIQGKFLEEMTEEEMAKMGITERDRAKMMGRA